MKQALQLKLGQQLTLTPQLQQAIKLLQLSTLDLQQAITETLESNPLLDEEEVANEAPLDADIKEQVDFSDTTSVDLPGTDIHCRNSHAASGQHNPIRKRHKLCD